MISKNGKFKKFIIKDKEKENDFINKTWESSKDKGKRIRTNQAIAVIICCPNMSIAKVCEKFNTNISTIKSRLYDIRYQDVADAAVGSKLGIFNDILEKADNKSIGEWLRQDAIKFFLQQNWNQRLSELKAYYLQNEKANAIEK